MKAYFAVKYHEDNKNRKKIEQIKAIFEIVGVNLVCVASDFEKWGTHKFEASDLMSISFKEIKSSEFVLVDLTEKGVGVGIEAGYAYANNIPIITIAKSPATISNTLMGITAKAFIYNKVEDLCGIFVKENIKEFIG